jgi:hypothetical protein
VLTVLRDTTLREVRVTLGRVTQTMVKIERDTAATPQAIAIRDAWLKQ